MIKYIYCIISGDRDLYAQQCYLSILSLRIHMPEACVVVFTDHATSRTGKFSGIRKLATDVRVMDFEEGLDNRQRSRLLKMLYRDQLSGDLMYIDADTLICGSLDDITDTDAELGMVYDQHIKYSDKRYRVGNEKKRADRCGWDVCYNGEFFNGGMMWCRDSEKTHEFFRLWMKYYREGWNNNVFNDQASLNYTNILLKGVISPLSGIWNCQFTEGVQYLAGARVLHYFATGADMPAERGLSPYYLARPGAFEGLDEHNMTGNAEDLPGGLLEILRDPRGAGAIDYTCIQNVDSAAEAFAKSNIYKAAYKVFRLLAGR